MLRAKDIELLGLGSDYDVLTEFASHDDTLGPQVELDSRCEVLRVIELDLVLEEQL